MAMLIALLLLLGVAIYLSPTIIAIIRGHAYVGVIIALNLLGGWTVLGWFAALIWALWPREKALIDPVIHNVTGIGQRNSRDALGPKYGRGSSCGREQKITILDDKA